MRLQAGTETKGSVGEVGPRGPLLALETVAVANRLNGSVATRMTSRMLDEVRQPPFWGFWGGRFQRFDFAATSRTVGLTFNAQSPCLGDRLRHSLGVTLAAFAAAGLLALALPRGPELHHKPVFSNSENAPAIWRMAFFIAASVTVTSSPLAVRTRTPSLSRDLSREMRAPSGSTVRSRPRIGWPH